MLPRARSFRTQQRVRRDTHRPDPLSTPPERGCTRLAGRPGRAN
jgi:hypothetical protein